LAVFLYRLDPPRPTFPSDITPAEEAAMRRHFAYWAERISNGQVLVVGPVLDPSGTHGIGVLTVDDRASATAICEGDPVLTEHLGFSYGLFDMPNAMLKGAD
jgi:hypothetical protein